VQARTLLETLLHTAHPRKTAGPGWPPRPASA